MNIQKNHLSAHNDSLSSAHQRKLNYLKEDWSHLDLENIIQKLRDILGSPAPGNAERKPDKQFHV